jgi:hypothetical protein
VTLGHINESVEGHMRYGVRIEMAGLGREQYDALHGQLASPTAEAPGFVAHIAGPTQSGWYILEVWESKSDFERFMQEKVAPLMPPGAPTPQIEEFEVHNRQTKGQLIA